MNHESIRSRCLRQNAGVPGRWLIANDERGLHRAGFTILELLVVIAIIAVLMALLFPAIRWANEGGRKSQAAADVRRITLAVQSFYTEYGRYPFVQETRRRIDIAVGDGGIGLEVPNRELFYTLRAMDAGVNAGFEVNPRRVVYFEGKNASDPDRPTAS